ncbi:hypothetical protein, partial [Ralstonia pseudosolanacearum]|uniref:hypothetical protein n=1 Tax=Ralstonia pseudosolanacearum TaxID=1310165 RepID=UPI001E4BC93D
GKSRESTQSAGLFTALSVWTVARKRQLAAWRGGFMQQRQSGRTAASETASVSIMLDIQMQSLLRGLL